MELGGGSGWWDWAVVMVIDGIGWWRWLVGLSGGGGRWDWMVVVVGKTGL